MLMIPTLYIVARVVPMFTAHLTAHILHRPLTCRIASPPISLSYSCVALVFGPYQPGFMHVFARLDALSQHRHSR